MGFFLLLLMFLNIEMLIIAILCQDVHGKLHWDWSTSYEGDT